MTAVLNEVQEDLSIFDARFWRCYRMLYFIACRILRAPERAEEAIGNCWHTASHLPRFEYEGEFRSWLLRVLIDEALALLREDERGTTAGASRQAVPTQVFRSNDMGNVRTDGQDRRSQNFAMALE